LDQKNNDDDDDAPVGMIVTLVLMSAILCVLLTLYFLAKRNKKDQGASRSIDAQCQVLPGSQDDDLDKMYEAKLADDISIDTETSEVVFAVEDIEQRSS